MVGLNTEIKEKVNLERVVIPMSLIFCHFYTVNQVGFNRIFIARKIFPFFNITFSLSAEIKYDIT